jgi:DNA adenine methylase
MAKRADQWSPLTYYGGKARMAHNIIPLLYPHTVYVEPFAGGLNLLFKKGLPVITNHTHYREVVNDINSDLVNFYRVLRNNGEELASLLKLTPYSREEHRQAKIVLANPESSDLERAWAFYIRCNWSYANNPNGNWSVGKVSTNLAANSANKKDKLLAIANRFRNVNVEHDDALSVIFRWDSPHTLFYCDPPYPGSDQGHYAGYTAEHFNTLCAVLNNCKGSFVLSNYAQESADAYGWERLEFGTYCSGGKDKDTRRTEVIWRRPAIGKLRKDIKAILEKQVWEKK